MRVHWNGRPTWQNDWWHGKEVPRPSNSVDQTTEKKQHLPPQKTAPQWPLENTVTKGQLQKLLETQNLRRLHEANTRQPNRPWISYGRVIVAPISQGIRPFGRSNSWCEGRVFQDVLISLCWFVEVVQGVLVAEYVLLFHKKILTVSAHSAVFQSTKSLGSLIVKWRVWILSLKISYTSNLHKEWPLPLSSLSLSLSPLVERPSCYRSTWVEMERAGMSCEPRFLRAFSLSRGRTNPGPPTKTYTHTHTRPHTHMDMHMSLIQLVSTFEMISFKECRNMFVMYACLKCCGWVWDAKESRTQHFIAGNAGSQQTDQKCKWCTCGAMSCY